MLVEPVETPTVAPRVSTSSTSKAGSTNTRGGDFADEPPPDDEYPPFDPYDG
jgi:hypothetical protein